QKLPTLIPEWKDTDRGKKEFAEVRTYLAKEGVPDQLVSQLVDAVQIRIARKAMLWDKAQAVLSKPAAPAKPAPKVLKPGAARPDANPNPGDDAMKRLRQSGNILDAAAAIRARI